MNPGVMLIPILVLFAYLLGSIPFSQLITSWHTGLNLREVGEGSVGSRNVWGTWSARNGDWWRSRWMRSKVLARWR
jgi:glycerol-3-phosphate acyltransferase PlsY